MIASSVATATPFLASEEVDDKLGFPVDFGGIELEPQGKFALVRRQLIEIRTKNSTASALAPNSVVFDIVAHLISGKVELQTNFSGEVYRQDLESLCDRLADRNEPAILAHALWLSALDRGATESQRNLAILFLAIVIKWPVAYFSKLSEIQRSILDGSLGLQEFPSIWSITIAARVLRLAHERGATPAAIAALIVGGVGIAWSSAAFYADVEVTNDNDIMFHTSSDRKKVRVVQLTSESKAIQSELDEMIRARRDAERSN